MHLKGAAGSTARERLSAWIWCWGTVVKGEGEEVWEHMKCFSFLGTCFGV